MDNDGLYAIGDALMFIGYVMGLRLLLQVFGLVGGKD